MEKKWKSEVHKEAFSTWWKHASVEEKQVSFTPFCSSSCASDAFNRIIGPQSRTRAVHRAPPIRWVPLVS